MKQFLSTNRASYDQTDTSFLFSILRLATVVAQARVPGVVDNKAMNEMLGSLFAHVCGNDCPLKSAANLRDQDKSFLLDFFAQLLKLCHLSVCSSRPDCLRPNLAGMTWKAYKVLISKFGGGLSSRLPCDAILKEWSTIFKSVYASLNSHIGPNSQIDSSLKYLRYCVVVLISVVQSIAQSTPVIDGGGLACLVYQITCVRSELPPCPASSKWPEGIEGKIASQLLSPLDSLFIHLLSSTSISTRGNLLNSFVSRPETLWSGLSPLSPVAKLSLLLPLMMHGPQSFPLETFESCFDWVLESPSTCFASYVDNCNPKTTPLFYKVTLAVFTYVTALQDPNSVQKAFGRLVSFAFHTHYLTREIAKESWSLLVTNGTETTKSTTRKVIISLVNSLESSIKSRYSHRILARLITSLAPLCFSEANPFPLEFPLQPTMPDLCKFLRKSVFISPQFLSSSQRRNICDSGSTWCLRTCAGFLKKEPGCNLEEVGHCLQFFSWVLSHPTALEVVPVFSRQKISELVIVVISSPQRRNRSCLRSCLTAIKPLFGQWSPQEQLSCLQGLQASYSSDPDFAGPILRLVGQVCQHLKNSPYLSKVYEIIVGLLSKGLSHTGDVIEAIAVFSTLELLATCNYDTQFLLAAFGEHQQKIRNLVGGEAPPSSKALVDEMGAALSKKPSRKRKGAELSQPSRSMNQIKSGEASCEEEMQQFMECMRRLEGVLPYASPQVQQGVMSRMRAETNRVCGRFGGGPG